MGFHVNGGSLPAFNEIPKMVIQASGNVGIGMTSPAYKFEVETCNDNEWISQMKHIGSTNIHGLLVDVNINTSDSELFRLDSSDVVGAFSVRADSYCKGRIWNVPFRIG